MKQQAMFPAPAAPELKLSQHFAFLATTPGTIGDYKVVKRVQCEECVWTLHEARGKGEPPRGARKKYVGGGATVLLCGEHATLWRERAGGKR